MCPILLYSLIGLLCMQPGRSFPDRERSKRGTSSLSDTMEERFDSVLEKLDKIDDKVEETKNDVIEYIQDHVWKKLKKNIRILEVLHDRQGLMMFCKADGNPCANGGSCRLNARKDSYTCTCSFGWRGPTCEVPMTDPCGDNVCQNYGSCNNGTCMCAEGYIGDSCEEGMCDQKLEEYNAMEMPMPGMEQPRCDDDGTYAPYQYMGSQAVCVTKGGVALLKYSVDRWDPKHTLMGCECARQEYQYHLEGRAEQFTDTCLPEGSFIFLLTQ